ncbi:TPR domain-containing protein [Dactylonectria estremocensis]|uniref:TPR domain-containing protein n=1 Tax=Dactylonectria estremocensis TaxID=1079267 RepID=A0A9P9EG96_9HYPO|nr:TPR domain-containing protein [Dactylonectria estremocensis]
MFQEYLKNGSPEILDASIEMGRMALKRTPDDHPDLNLPLNNLAVRLGAKYQLSGEMKDLVEAIEMARKSLAVTPADHPSLAGRTHNLGSMLELRRARSGAMQDLDEAIDLGREAARICTKDYPGRGMILNTLGVQLGSRYSRTGALADLNEAIQMAREAIDSVSKDDPDRVRWLSNLGCVLGFKYLRTNETPVLDEAIAKGREAIETAPKNYPFQADLMDNLASQLGHKYWHTEEVSDLFEAISASQRAVDLTAQNNPDYARLLNNLGGHLMAKYDLTSDVSDLDEGIRMLRKSVEATPKDHPDLAGRLHNLGSQLGSRHLLTETVEDRKEHIQCHIAALNHKDSPINDRISISRTLLRHAFLFDNRNEAYLFAKTTIELVPLLAPPSLESTDKQQLLSDLVGLASNAAAIALLADQSPTSAIELLETGRGVIASSLQDMRADLSALEEEYPELAGSFINLRDQLDAPTSQGTLLTADNTRVLPQPSTDTRHKASNQLQPLVEKIRRLPGFERFLLSASEAEIREAASFGPIVIINVSVYRCDALIVRESRIQQLPLPNLSQADISSRQKDVQSLETLAWLWDVVVGPILECLGFNESPSEKSPWPHVWWIPTGPLVRFPLHAAGRHLKRGSESALDRVISSYSSSIRTMIRSRQHGRQEQETKLSQNALLVAMHQTPQQQTLQHTNNEVQAVHDVLNSMQLQCLRPDASKQQVLSVLDTCKVFHFAGHGKTDKRDPLQSLLLLDDWEKDPLTVASLFKTNLSHLSPFLAYLSACGTGQVLDDKSIDESIHLTSAFQLAGFQHVIGTLWDVDDELCVRMARSTYEFLRDNGMRDQFVSEGLHRASRQLRDDWVRRELGDEVEHGTLGLRSTRDVEICEDEEPSRPLWVPYIHYGV